MTAAVIGIGRTPFTTRADVSAAALAAHAIRAAVDDAGIAWEEVDGVVRFDREALWDYDLPGVMRLPALGYYGAVPDSPGSAPALVRLATMAVTLGLARVVVGYHARAEPRPALPAEVVEVVGIESEPPATQGGCAFVVAAGPRPGRPAVRVLASMQWAIPSAARHVDAWRESRRDQVLHAATRRLFADAGITPASVDLACVYAHPPGLVALALADHGLAGRAGVRVNPHAGGPDAAALDGMDDLLEAVRQLRGDAAAPVPDADIALVAGSPLEPTSSVLLAASR
jgi:hypothetical protein